MPSVPITTTVVSSNPDHGEVYSIQHYVIKFVLDLRQIFFYPRYARQTTSIYELTYCGVTVFLLAYSSGYHETWQQLTSKAIGDITHHIGAKKKKPMYVGSFLPIIISMSDLNLRYPEIRAKISKRYEFYETTRIRGRFYGWSVLLIFLVFCVVLLCVFWVSYCDVRYDFRIKTMFGSSLPAVVCRRAHVLFTLFVFVCV